MTLGKPVVPVIPALDRQVRRDLLIGAVLVTVVMVAVGWAGLVALGIGVPLGVWQGSRSGDRVVRSAQTAPALALDQPVGGPGHIVVVLDLLKVIAVIVLGAVVTQWGGAIGFAFGVGAGLGQVLTFTIRLRRSLAALEAERRERLLARRWFSTPSMFFWGPVGAAEVRSGP